MRALARTPAVFGQRIAKLPSILDDNALFNDECESTSGWTTLAGSLSSTGGELVVTGTGGTIRRDTGLSLASNDWIVYWKQRVQRGTGRFAGFNLATNAGTTLVAFNYGYDWTSGGSGAASDGAISVWANAGGTKKLLSTSENYDTTGFEFCIHVDRDRSVINIFRKVSGKWAFLTNITYFAGITGFNRIIVDSAGGTATQVNVEHITIARPNMVAIGDSICAGATLFDPNPATYVGDDNNDSTWMKHAVLFPTLRNTLIVNKGIGSQTSAQISSRIAEATAHSPRVIFLHASSNDEISSVSQATRTSNIQSTVNSIKSAGAKCVLLNAMCATAGSSNNTGGRDLMNYTRNWWSNERPSLSGLDGSIDIMVPVRDLDTTFQRSSLTQSDGIHPTADGYQLIGEFVASHFARRPWLS